MFDIFYMVMLLAFIALAAVTFFSATIRSVPYKQELGRLLELQNQLDEQVVCMRRELRNLELDISILTDDEHALQEQVACMREVEDAHHLITRRLAEPTEETET